MRISKEIQVNRERLSSGLSAALSLCGEIQNSTDDNDVLCFSDSSFVTPTFILPLFVYLKSLLKSVTFGNVTDYMRKIKFDSMGVDTNQMRPTEFAAFLEQYAGKSYLPLVCFPATSVRIHDGYFVLEAVEAMIRKQAGLESNIVTGLKYMINEIVDNIGEHSMSDNGYILAQSYPAAKFIDVCIGDTGLTLLGSYNRCGINVAKSDKEAIEAANNGMSTKNRPKAENRGFGIRTTKNMLVDGMGGQYLMLSGSSVYIDTPMGGGYVDLPHNIHIKGTITAFRIPFENRGFWYAKYTQL